MLKTSSSTQIKGQAYAPLSSPTGFWLPDEKAGLHKSPLGVYNFPFLPLSDSVIKTEKRKNSGTEKESRD